MDNTHVDTVIYDLHKLPDGVTISTMCASCKIDHIVDINNIKEYLELNNQDILTIKKSKWSIRTLIPIKVVKPIINETPAKNFFFNQITIVIRIKSSEITDNKELLATNTINLKLFKNGSVQMSGCKNIEDINIILNKLFVRLLDNYYNETMSYIPIPDTFKDMLKIKDLKCLNEISDKKILNEWLLHDKELLIKNMFSVNKFKIDMINANYKIPMQIDRIKLYKLLQLKEIKCYYEPCIRACVIVKYVPPIECNTELKEISISIFQKGNIIITGARSKQHIISSYEYINDLLLQYKSDIIRNNNVDEDELIENACRYILMKLENNEINID